MKAIVYGGHDDRCKRISDWEEGLRQWMRQKLSSIQK
jgi:hypothetical protein